MKQLRILLVFFAMTLAGYSCSFAEPVEWHMLNVNFHRQGDAHLLRDGSTTVMIDAGEKHAAEIAVVPYLRAKNIGTIDHLFISHPHTDHYAGIDALLSAGTKIENIYFNLPPEGIEDWNYKRHEFLAMIERAKQAGSNTYDVAKGFELNLPSSQLKVLYAHKQPKLKNGRRVSVNDYSLIMQWEVGDFRALFTGDLNEPLGSELAEHPHLKADILKVPHHGATNVAPNEFFDTVDPKLNMFPSTAALWNHPRLARVRAWTIGANIYFCHNGLNGNVVLLIKDSMISAKVDKPTNRCPNRSLDITPGVKIESPSESVRFLPSTLNLLL